MYRVEKYLRKLLIIILYLKVQLALLAHTLSIRSLDNLRENMRLPI